MPVVSAVFRLQLVGKGVTLVAGPVPVLAPCVPMLPSLRGHSHTRGSIWQHVTEGADTGTGTWANSSISAMRPQCYSFSEGIVILGVVYGSMSQKAQTSAAVGMLPYIRRQDQFQ